MPTELILKTIKGAEKRRLEGEAREENHRWMMFTMYVTITYVIILRGLEG